MVWKTPLVVAATLAVVGCGTPDPATNFVPVANAKVQDVQPTNVIEGQASYYARRFAGRRMANGQAFDPNSNSAAHRWLPFGTPLHVTNTANGRTTIVIVRDRGPFSGRRVLDVSPRTAEVLGMKGAGVAHIVARTASREMVEVAEARE